MSVLTCTVSVSNITSLEWKESRQKGCGEGKEVEKVEVDGREGEREREEEVIGGGSRGARGA